MTQERIDEAINHECMEDVCGSDVYCLLADEHFETILKAYRQEITRRESAEKALLATEKCINTQNAWDTVQTARKVVIAHKNLVKEMEVN